MLWGTEDMSYKQLVSRLRSRFGSEDLEERYQSELQSRRRGPKESLRELAQDIRRLMMLSYPGDHSPIWEKMAKEHFIMALEDPELELKIREREPRTLDSALKSAQRIEVFRDTVRQPKHYVSRQVTEDWAQFPVESVAKVEQSATEEVTPSKELRETRCQMTDDQVAKASRRGGRKKRSQRNRDTEEVRRDSWKEDLLKRVKELEQAQQAAEANSRKIAAEKEALNKEVERLQQIEQLHAFPTPPSYPTFTPQDCPPHQHYPRICFKCGEPGHIARECLQQSNAGVQLVRDDNTDGLSRMVPVDCYRYLRVTLCRQVVDCLLDSGSEVCLLPCDVVPPNCIRATESTLTAANGVSIPILGAASLPLSIGRFSTTITALVSRHVTEPILGIDFLVINGIVWDFAKSSITVAGMTHSLLPKYGRHHRCRKVALQESVPVPVKSRVILPTKVKLKRRPDMPVNKCRSIGLSQMGQGLHVSHTLLPCNAGTCAKVPSFSKENVPQKPNLPVSHLQRVGVLQRVQPQSKVSPTVRRVKNGSVSGFTRKSAEDANVTVLKTVSHALEACLSPCLDLAGANGNDFGRGQLRPDTRRGGTIDQRDVKRQMGGRHFVRRCSPHQF